MSAFSVHVGGSPEKKGEDKARERGKQRMARMKERQLSKKERTAGFPVPAQKLPPGQGVHSAEERSLVTLL